MTGYESKKKAAQDKLDNDDLTIAYQSGYYDGKKAAQESAAWATKEDFYRELDRRVERMRKEMEIKTVTMRCKDYDVALPIIDTDFGHVLVGQVSTLPQRTWVDLTDEEIYSVLENLQVMYNRPPTTDSRIIFARSVLAKSKEKNT